MLLYIHVPFCRKKCRYCAFASGPFSRARMQTYVDLLLQEIALRGRGSDDTLVETVYFGGGTPSLVPADDLARILERITSLFNVASDAEITLEANPDSANDPQYLTSIRALGINRLSLGVQSLHAGQLALLGRIHSPDQALQTFAAARRAGFTNISLDFIWGIPGQTTENWLEQAEQAAALGPEHLSCYGLSVEPHTPLENDVNHHGLILPDDDEQARMFLEGSALLASHGYHHYEISSYARTGHESRHNRGYWQGREYLGLGPAAVSTRAGKRWQNPSNLTGYEAALSTHTLDAHAETLSPENLQNEHIMLSLRTSAGLDLKDFAARYGTHFVENHTNYLNTLKKNGLAHITETSLFLTPRGMLVSNAIIAGFMDT